MIFNKVSHMKRLVSLLIVLALLFGSVHIPVFGYYNEENQTSESHYTEDDNSYGDNYTDADYGYDNGYSDNDYGYDNGYSDNDYGYNDNDYSDDDYNYEDYYTDEEEYEDEEKYEEEELPPVAGMTGITPVPFNAGLNVTLTGVGADAQVVNFADTNSTFTGNIFSTNSTPQMLEVIASFTPGTTSRTIEIEIDNGFGFMTAPGMVGSRVPNQGQSFFDNFAFNPALLAGDHAIFISGAQFNRHVLDTITGRTYIEQRARADHPHVIAGTLAEGTLINTYQPLGGIFVYTITPDANTITLDIGVISDWAFAMQMTGGGYRENPITVRVIEDGITTAEQTLERYEMTGQVGIRAIRVPGYTLTARDAANPTWTSQIGLNQFASPGTSATGNRQLLHERISFSVNVPKQIVGADSITNNPWLTVALLPGTQLTPEMFSYEITDPGGTFYQVTITLTQANHFVPAGAALFEITGTIPTNPTPTAGNDGISATPTDTNSIIIPLGHTSPHPVLFSTAGNNRISIPQPFNYSLSIYPIHATNRLSGTPSILPLAPLGGFSIENSFTVPLEDQAIFVSFPSETLQHIGVRGFRLPAGQDGIQNIVATVQTRDNVGNWSNQRQIRIDGPLAINFPATSVAPFAAVEISFMPYLGENEFITALYYEFAGDVPVGSTFVRGTGFSNPIGYVSFLYLGQMFAPIPGGTVLPAHAYVGQRADLNPVSIPAGNRDDISDLFYNNTTVNMTISNDALFAFVLTTPDIISGVNTTLVSGNTMNNIGITFNRITTQRGGANVFSVQGFYVYLRSPSGVVNIEQSSIVVTNAGNTWSVAQGTILPEDIAGVNDMAISQITDSSGSKVYRLRLPQAIAGHLGENFNDVPVDVSMDITALPTAPSGIVFLHDLFMVRAMDNNITTETNGTLHVLDESTFHFGTLGEMVAAPHRSLFFNIQGVAEVLVGTQVAPVRNGVTGTFASFDPADPASMLNLTLRDQIELNVTVANNSPAAASDFYAIIPVPRAGLTAGSNFQDVPGGFDMEFASIEGIVPAGYTIRFATAYTETRAGATWMELSGVTDANRGDIRSIMIERTGGPIPAGDRDSFYIRLTPDWDTIVLDRDQWDGTQNIYASRMFSASTLASGHRPGARVGIRLLLGEVEGIVFNDTNANGVLDTGETGIAGVIVRAYNATTNELVMQTTTAVNGSYRIVGVNVGQPINIVVTNPETQASLRFSNHGARLNIAANHTSATTVGVVASQNNTSWNWNAVNIGLRSGSVNEYEITYQFTGNIPIGTGAPTQPSSRDVDAGTPSVSPTSVVNTFTGVNSAGVAGTWTFGGWTTTSNGANATSFTMPNNNVHFTGNWTFNATIFEVSYEKDGYIPTGAPATPSARDVAAGTPNVSGTSITPTWVEGYENSVAGIWTFSGWEAPAPLGTTFTMPNSNVVFSGEWEFTAGTPNVIYTVTGARPSSYSGMPASPQAETSGTTVTVAAVPTTTATTNSAGTAGTWTFNGWNHPTITGSTFTMPNDNVEFTGSWSFTADSGGGNGYTPNQELVKRPDRMLVSVGETINWTLRGFHNPVDGTVADFTIIDMPGRGLNFQSGRLPAFTNGEGVTYDIRYIVTGSDQWRTHATGVDASRPFTFSLPQPGNLHYTDIGIFFGDVPAGFGLGNEIVLPLSFQAMHPTMNL